MRIFLFLFLAGYAVRCDDKSLNGDGIPFQNLFERWKQNLNTIAQYLGTDTKDPMGYYVVRMPPEPQSKEFKVYWNVPTMQCKSKKIPFEDLYEKYGIIQNTNDTHRGDKISILYDPGNFPALIKDETTGEIKYRNGGVPQQGDLVDHIQVFRNELEQSIPDEDFNGVGVIDFESWRPILRQNFGVLTPYKDVSYDIEMKRHWWWKKQWIYEEAKRRFEEAGRDFMQTTLALAKKLRPKALWGYYGYPQCFNKVINSNPEKCADEVPTENNDINWLWTESTALFPSVYSNEDMTRSQLAGFIRGRVKESIRVREKGVPVLPYWWLRYRDDGYFTQKDLEVAFTTFYKSNASGFIIWGSSKDVNTKEKCKNLSNYVTNILGPTVAKYTKYGNKIDVLFDESLSTTLEPEDTTGFDPEYNWVPPENYTQNIEHIVDEELKKENENKFEINEKLNESALITIVLHKIANYCSGNCYDKIHSDADVTSIAPSVLTTKDPFKGTSIRSETTAPTTTEDDGFVYDYLDASTVVTKDKNIRDDYYTTSTITNTIKSDDDKNLSNNILSNISTVKSINENDKLNYHENSTSINNIVDDEVYISSNDTSNVKSSSNKTDVTVGLYDMNSNTLEVSVTDLNKEESNIIIWSNSSMDNIVNTSVKMDDNATIGAVSTTADDVLTEQVVVSVV